MLSILFSCTEIHIYFPSYFLPHCINGRRPNIYYYLFFQLTKPNNIKIWCLCIKNRKKNTLAHYALFLSLKFYSFCVICIGRMTCLCMRALVHTYTDTFECVCKFICERIQNFSHSIVSLF